MTNQQKSTLEKYNQLLTETKDFFQNINEEMQIDNHQQHNVEPYYKDILLKDIVSNPESWKGKTALDFGCGCGRNIKNLLEWANFNRVDGCDISHLNADYSLKYAESFFGEGKCNTWETDGATLYPCEDEVYDFIMSHQVFQHIANYEVRYSILTDIYRVLKPEGKISIHFLNLGGSSLGYYDNNNYGGPTTLENVTIENFQHVVDDLEKIGFKDVTCDKVYDFYQQRPEFYFKARKI
jgi:ubiquinone/menaquinone biosynthesis C-methylase UbiE